MGAKQFPNMLPQFQRFFPDDTACAKYLEAMRWPTGFVCPGCGLAGNHWRYRSKAALRCKWPQEVYTSLKVGTIMLEHCRISPGMSPAANRVHQAALVEHCIALPLSKLFGGKNATWNHFRLFQKLIWVSS